MNMFMVVGSQMDPENGSISPVTGHLFRNEDDALAEMKEMYFAELKSRRLENNGTCDETTQESISGGYLTANECGIYDYAEFAMGQLLELFYLCVKTVDFAEK